MDWLYLRNITLFPALFVVFILHVSIDAQGYEPFCTPQMNVRRGIVYRVCTNKSLVISCNIKFCDDQKMNVTWTKLDKNTSSNIWISIDETSQMRSAQNSSSSNQKELISYLTFSSISKHHEGLYRCELQSPNFSLNSHTITVSVFDDSLGDMNCTGMPLVTDSPANILPSRPNLWWLPYFFICMCVVILVLIVMLISMLPVNGFKCLRRKSERDFISVQYFQDALQKTHNHNTSSGSLPSEQSKRRDNSSSQIVYASLNHLTPAQLSAIPRQRAEETSEYASIRVS